MHEANRANMQRTFLMFIIDANVHIYAIAYILPKNNIAFISLSNPTLLGIPNIQPMPSAPKKPMSNKERQ